MTPIRSILPRFRLFSAASSRRATAGIPTRQTLNQIERRGSRPILFVVALVGWLLALGSPASAKTPMQEYVEAMQPGWNLGNTLDASPNETSWGNPLVTQQFIQQIAAQGFKSIRIPVTWDSHLGSAPNYTVDPAWMNRVQQIVDWSLDAGLYVMINVHHDSGWIRSMPANHDGVLARYSAVWSQIAPRFRDHSNKLMFESVNEPNFDNADDATKMALLRELNIACFNIVRGTGGGNATRPLVLPSVATGSDPTFMNSLKATMTELNDPNLIATVHNYGFWPFSVNIAGVTRFDDTLIKLDEDNLDSVYNTFVANGVPVVIGEMGLLAYDSNINAVERGELLKFFEHFTAYAQAKGMTWQLWDNGYHFLDRTTYQWRDPELFSYLMHSVTGRSSTAETDLIFVRDGAPLTDVVIPLNLNGNSFLSLNDGATPLTLGSDYMINGSALTVKASALAPYASGSYGEKTVLTANFTGGGPSWKLHVRHQTTPMLSSASGIKGGDLVIPAAFNGDLVATMEARYVNGDLPYPGEQNWTSFKEYTQAYLPDYANNRITLKKAFLDHTTSNAVDLTLYFWSGKKENYRLTFQATSGAVEGAEYVIYNDSIPDGWYDWNSWMPHDLASTAQVHSGSKSISITPTAWGGLTLQNGWGQVVDTSVLRTLEFWVHGGATGGQSIGLHLIFGDDWGSSAWVGLPPLVANTWQKIEIPLASFNAEGRPNITGISFRHFKGEDAPTLYIDDIKFTSVYPPGTLLVIGAPAPLVTALVRHAPMLGGDLDGSLQLLNGESFTVDSGTTISGDLRVPGTPTVLVNGKSVVGGLVVDATGGVAPSNYTVAINKGAAVAHVVRRVDPWALSVVTVPALPSGKRSVTLTSASQSIGAAATLRNLTLSASAGSVAVPAGVYGNFAVNGSNTLVLGVAGANVPAVYELQSLTISHNASVKIVGPVSLKLASGVTIDGTLGSAQHPEWLDLQIASGGVTVNGSAAVNGVVTAPSGSVSISGTIHGRVNADRLTINGSGVLEDSATE